MILKLKIYVASSWRNEMQPEIVQLLRQAGHRVYDFRNPREGDDGFSWKEIDLDWQTWTATQYRTALRHPAAVRGYTNDINALKACDVCVLLLPSGRSASWELGYAMGQGKRCIVFLPAHSSFGPELMYREATIVTTRDELCVAIREVAESGPYA